MWLEAQFPQEFLRTCPLEPGYLNAEELKDPRAALPGSGGPKEGGQKNVTDGLITCQVRQLSPYPEKFQI